MNNFAKSVLACALLAASATASAKTTAIELDTSDLNAGTSFSISNFDAGDVFKVTFDLLTDTYLNFDLFTVTNSGSGSFSWVIKEVGSTPTKLVDSTNTGSYFDYSKVNSLFTAGSYVFKYTLGTTATASQDLTFSIGTSNLAPVPEPETYALMGVGLLGLLAARRRKASSALAV